MDTKAPKTTPKKAAESVTLAAYEDRMARVTDYVYEHLDEKIDLSRLAEIACLSPYHWHRVYHALRGETIAATVKRLRLHRAAGYLVQTPMSIAEIAGKSGYPSPQSFTRVFKSAYGVPPATYRRVGGHAQFRKQSRERISKMYDVSIKTVPNMKAVSVTHTGSYMQIGKAFDTLMRWCGMHGLLGPDSRSVGIYYDDPSLVPEEDLRSRAALITNSETAIEPPFERTDIAGGEYAVLRHVGPYAELETAYQWLYGDWLVASGREAADAPIFEEYLNDPQQTPPTDLVTEIYLPLK